MAITKVSGRQSPLVAEVSFTYANLTDAVAVVTVDLPANATVVGGGLYVDTVWNSATSDVADVGDGVDDNRYTPTPVDLQLLGYQPLDVSGYIYTAVDTVDIKWDGTGAAPTTGAARLQVWYTVANRALENQPAR
jgi:hypothetical protein